MVLIEIKQYKLFKMDHMFINEKKKKIFKMDHMFLHEKIETMFLKQIHKIKTYCLRMPKFKLTDLVELIF